MNWIFLGIPCCRVPLNVRRGSTTWRPAWPEPNFLNGRLILLCHKFFCRDRLPIGAAQHGHRDRVVASARINLLRIVAIEFGTWRSVRSGGASGSVTVGNGKFLEQSGGTRS